MNTRILLLFTRTPLHVGAGASVGAIDQPIQRERHTGFPIIPGSSLKGVLRDHLAGIGQAEIDALFGLGSDGKEFAAGKISFGEAKILAFPVRSAKGSFAMITCNLALERYVRASGVKLDVPKAPEDNQCLAGVKVVLDDKSKKPPTKAVALEEYRFNSAGEFSKEWEEHLGSLLADPVLKGAAGRWVLLSDGDFSHFVTASCPVQQHVRISDETGTAEDGGLFNEEVVPSESLFFASLADVRGAGEDNVVFKSLGQEQLVQFGGNGTIGLGYCSMKLC